MPDLYNDEDGAGEGEEAEVAAMVRGVDFCYVGTYACVSRHVNPPFSQHPSKNKHTYTCIHRQGGASGGSGYRRRRRGRFAKLELRNRELYNLGSALDGDGGEEEEDRWVGVYMFGLMAGGAYFSWGWDMSAGWGLHHPHALNSFINPNTTKTKTAANPRQRRGPGPARG